jgi:uncharacterized lipoprotein YddW (UPF0748 family)
VNRKRHTLILVSTFFLLFGTSSLQSNEKPIPKKPGSIWIVRHLLLSRKAIDRAIRDLEDTGLERVFIQVSGRLHSYFPSAILPVSEELTQRGDLNDPFGYFIEQAKKKGIEVHAWVNVLFAWSKQISPKAGEHPYNLHPEWFVHDDKGRSHRHMSLDALKRKEVPGYFISPAQPGFVNLIQRYIEEIVAKYHVDGIHLDYIRYPSRGTGFGDVERSIFERRYYVDPLNINGNDSLLIDRFGENGVRDLTDKWSQFRSELVTDLVRAIGVVLDRSGQDLELSAAVFPDPDSARVVYGQDWGKWLEEDLVDYTVIMNYTPSTGDFVNLLRKPAVAPYADFIVAGVSTYNQSIDHTIEKARYALDAGFAGVCFFSYNDISSKRKSLERIKQLLSGTR